MSQEQEAGTKNTLCRKWLRRILLGVVCLIGVAILFIVGYILVANYRGEAARERTLAELERREFPLGLPISEYSRSDFDKKMNLAEELEDGTRYYLAAFELSRFPAELGSDIPYQGFARDPELCKPVGNELVEAINVYTQALAPFYDLIERARRCSRFQYELDYFTHSLGGGRRGLTVLSGLRSASRQHLVLALHRQVTGDAEGALDACSAILDMSKSLKDESAVIVFLIRCAIERMAFEGTEQVLSRTTPNRKALNAAREKFLGALQLADLRDAWKGDIAYAAEYLHQPGLYVGQSACGFEWVLSRRVAREDRSYPSVSFDGEAPPSERKVHLLLVLDRVWFTLCPGAYKLRAVDSIEGCIKQYDLLDGSPQQLASKVKKVLANKQNSKSDEAGWARTALEALKFTARARVAAVALAVETYRVENGNWPDSLSQLKMEEDVLGDPFAGKRVVYRRNETGCLVYSVGENLTDNQGKYENTDYENKDDITFRLFNPQLRNKE